MVHKKRHHFLAQFSMPFHMVWSVLLQVLAQKTTFWLVEILWQPIRSFYSMVFEATTRNKMKHIMWKSMKNCGWKWCLFLCTILFEVTCVFFKMCFVVTLKLCHNKSDYAPYCLKGEQFLESCPGYFIKHAFFCCMYTSWLTYKIRGNANLTCCF